MSTHGALADRDLHALMAVIEDGRRDDPGPAVPWATLERLAHLIGCDEITFNEHQPRKFITNVAQAAAGSQYFVDENGIADDPHCLFWHYYWDFVCSYADRTGDFRARRFTDNCTMTELMKMPVYAEFYRPNGYVHSLGIGIPAAPGVTRKLFLSRGEGSDFSDRDVLILELLRPHIYDLFFDAERRRNGIPRLTARELEVLRLAAAGNSNRDIADRLFISTSTVRKHMEHIFDHTGTRTRAGAAAVVLPHFAGVTPPATAR